jgi:serine/threonine protein kinase
MYKKKYLEGDVLSLHQESNPFIIENGLFEHYIIHNEVLKKIIRFKSGDVINFINAIMFSGRNSVDNLYNSDEYNMTCRENSVVYILPHYILKQQYLKYKCSLQMYSNKPVQEISHYLDTLPFFSSLSVIDKYNLCLNSNLIYCKKDEVINCPSSPCIVCKGEVVHGTETYMMNEMLGNFQKSRANLLHVALEEKTLTFTVKRDCILMVMSLEMEPIILKILESINSAKEISQLSRLHTRSLSSTLLQDINENTFSDFKLYTHHNSGTHINLVGTELDALSFMNKQESNDNQIITFQQKAVLDTKSPNNETILAFCNNNRKWYTMKCSDKVSQARHEYIISRHLFNEFCVNSQAFFFFGGKCYIVKVFMPCTLKEMIDSMSVDGRSRSPDNKGHCLPCRKEKRTTNLEYEKNVKLYIGCIMCAIEYLHRNCLIYRDLKLENVVIDWQGYPRLMDFGNTKRIKPFMMEFTFAGSPMFMAPEIFLGHGYDYGCDMWSLGVLAYSMLTKRHLWKSLDHIDELMTEIVAFNPQKLEFPEQVSSNARDFVRQLLNPDPSLRPRCMLMKEHIWFSDISWKQLNNKEYTMPEFPNHILEKISFFFTSDS